MTLPERAKNLQDDGEALDEALQAVMTRYPGLTRQGRRHGAIGQGRMGCWSLVPGEAGRRRWARGDA